MSCLSHLVAVALVVVVSSASLARAENFYLSAAGNDANDGTSEGTAWRTIEHLNAMASEIGPGDTVFFRRGDTFQGGIVATESGTAEMPITYTAYGDGALPVISGLSEISGWTSAGSNLYEAVLPNEVAELNIVLAGDTLQAMGRYPRTDAANGGYLFFDSNAGNGSITDSDLAGAPNFSGGEIVVRLRHWILNRNRISTHSGNTITFTPFEGSAPDNLDNRFGYFIQNHVATLSANGDWAYDAASNTITMYAASPPTNVRASTVDNLFFANGLDHLVIENLAFEGANQLGVGVQYGEGLAVRGCTVRFTGNYAISVRTNADSLVENNTVSDSLNNGIGTRGGTIQNNVVRGNTVTRTGTIAGMGKTGNGQYNAIVLDVDRTGIIEDNIVTDTGYLPISFYGSDITVTRNFIDRFCYVKDDGGGIYTFVGASMTRDENRVVSSNIIMHAVGAPNGTSDPDSRANGVYVDNNTVNVEVRDNSIFDVGQAIHGNSPQNIIITGNNIFDANEAIGLSRWLAAERPDLGGQDITGFQVYDNVFFARRPEQIMFFYYDRDRSMITPEIAAQRLMDMGAFDGNFYAIQNDFNFAYTDEANSMAIPLPVSIDAWRDITGFEEHSVVRDPLRNHEINSVDTTNKATLGTFEGGSLSGVGTYLPNSASAVAWDGTSKLTGTGSLMFTSSDVTSRSYTISFAPMGSVSSDNDYLLRFSTYGSTNAGHALVGFRQGRADYTPLSPYQHVSFGEGREDHEVWIHAPTTYDDARWVIEISQSSGTTYVDDVEVYEADVTAIDIDPLMRFEYNATHETRTVALDAVYVDVRGNEYSGEVVLEPFRSVTLVRTGEILWPMIDAGFPDPDGGLILGDGGARIDGGVLGDGGGSGEGSAPLSPGCGCEIAGAGPRWGFGAHISALVLAILALRRRSRRSA